MMTHSVYFWLKEEAQSKRAEFEQALRDLMKIDLIRRFSICKPASTPPRPVTDHSFDYALLMDFDSVADHDAYQEHPDHHVFVNRCKDWWAKVVVYDSVEL